jgi:cation diffusion facilitator family transporter
MDNNHRYIIARRATLNSAAANTALALVKIFGGYFGNSYALLADGIHSLSDLITDGLVIIAAKAGGQLPDKEHPYGHQRIETIAAILLALILAAVAFSIAYDAIHLIFNQKPVPRPEYATMIIAVISIGAKEWLYR